MESPSNHDTYFVLIVFLLGNIICIILLILIEFIKTKVKKFKTEAEFKRDLKLWLQLAITKKEVKLRENVSLNIEKAFINFEGVPLPYLQILSSIKYKYGFRVEPTHVSISNEAIREFVYVPASKCLLVYDHTYTLLDQVSTVYPAQVADFIFSEIKLIPYEWDLENLFLPVDTEYKC